MFLIERIFLLCFNFIFNCAIGILDSILFIHIITTNNTITANIITNTVTTATTEAASVCLPWCFTLERE